MTTDISNCHTEIGMVDNFDLVIFDWWCSHMATIQHFAMVVSSIKTQIQALHVCYSRATHFWLIFETDKKSELCSQFTRQCSISANCPVLVVMTGISHYLCTTSYWTRLLRSRIVFERESNLTDVTELWKDKHLL
jgi:hypothetical protein